MTTQPQSLALVTGDWGQSHPTSFLQIRAELHCLLPLVYQTAQGNPTVKDVKGAALPFILDRWVSLCYVHFSLLPYHFIFSKRLTLLSWSTICGNIKRTSNIADCAILQTLPCHAIIGLGFLCCRHIDRTSGSRLRKNNPLFDLERRSGQQHDESVSYWGQSYWFEIC